MSNNVSNKDLADKIDELQHSFYEYKIASESRLTYLETCLEINKEDVDNLKKRDYIVIGINTVAATIAGILGVNK